MLTILYCDKCKDEMCKSDPFIFEFFDFIVDQYFHDSPLEISTNIHDCTHEYVSMIKFLEAKNYIVSTECSIDTIQVKPLGFDKSGQTLKVCCFCPEEKGVLQWD